MKSIFESTSCQEILDRIDQLNPNALPKWGKMSVEQMLWHCQGPLNIILEKHDYKLKPNWLVKTFFKKSLYNDKPWRKSLPTTPVFKATENKDFNSEKVKLLNLINELHEQKDKEQWQAHPIFGHFTKAQWGQMQYKHLDHHLNQFGV